MAFTVFNTAPFRADSVGSFLRPEELVNARKLHKHGLLDAAGLKQVEDKCIRDLVAKQIAHGLKGFTDGEFRRSWWHLDFLWALNGVESASATAGYTFVGIETRPETALLVGKLSGENHAFVEHFKFVKSLEQDGTQARQTIPSPAQTLSILLNPRNKDQSLPVWRDFYANEEELAEAVAAAYRQVYSDLYDAGCRCVQIDDCALPLLCDAQKVEKWGLDVKHLSELYVYTNNASLRDKQSDLTVTTHFCRGNYRSHFASNGAYDAIANSAFATENVDGFYLEYDDARSGSFEALKFIPKDKRVVLGIVSSKLVELEDLQELEARVKDAANFFPLENLCVSPQCGFASTEEGNALTEAQQWAKIDLVVELAHRIWG